MNHQLRANSAARLLVLGLLAAGALACSGDTGDAGDTGLDTAPDASDSGDATPDSTPDADPDVDPDAGDTTPDVEPDVTPDADPDADPDAGPGLGDDDLDPTGGAWSAAFGAAGALGAIGATVYAAEVGPSGDIYVGGAFDRIGGVDARNIARWDGSAWHAIGDGVDLTVHAIEFGDADEPEAATIHVAGTAAGGGFIAPPNQLFRWDGTTWEPQGDVLDQFATIHDLAWIDGALWLAGDFANIGELEVAGIAVWDGAAMARLEAEHAGVNGSVQHIFVRDGNPCLAGFFDSAFGLTSGPVVCREGDAWTPLGDTLNSTVRDVVVLDDGRVIAGGDFSIAIGDPSEGNFVVGLAELIDGVWTPLAGGVGGGLVTKVRDLLPTPEGLYVGGQFTGAGTGSGGVAASNVALLAEDGWSALAAGVINRSTISIEPGVFAMAPMEEGEVIVGGLYSLAGDIGAVNIARWDGTAWSNVFEEGKDFLGAAGQTFAFATDGEVLYAGGSFVAMGAAPAQNIARWSRGRWESLGGGLPGDVVRTLAIDGDGVIAGGAFYEVGITGASFLARWDGATWRAYEPQLNGTVNDVAICPDGSVVVVGDFTAAGELTLGGVALWRDGEWDDLGGGFAAAEDSWLSVRTAECDDDNTIFVGGRFGTAGGAAVANLARYVDGAWSAVGGAPDDQVDTLSLYGGELYAGGGFAQVGGTEAARIARWDGDAWHALGDGLGTGLEFSPGSVYAIAPKSNGLFAIGYFEQSGATTARFVAWWDGSTWHALGEGMNDIAEAGIVFDSSLWVGGVFSQAGGLPSLGIARWEYGAR